MGVEPVVCVGEGVQVGGLISASMAPHRGTAPTSLLVE